MNNHFNSSTLVELELYALCMCEILSSGYLPFLKTLSLFRVKFDNKYIFHSVMFATSKVLEEMHITSPNILFLTCNRNS